MASGRSPFVTRTVNKNHHPIEVAIVGVIALLQAALWLARVLLLPLAAFVLTVADWKPAAAPQPVDEPEPQPELILQLACATASPADAPQMAVMPPSEDELMALSCRQLMAMAGTKSKRHSKRRLVELIRSA